jgi:hypothetical protein
MSVTLDAALPPCIGSAYRHINAGRDVREFSRAGLYGKNRWYAPDEPTLYLAGDVGVAVAEWGRRFPASYPDASAHQVVRDVCQLHLRLDAVLEVRSDRVTRLLGVAGAPEIFRDMDAARSIARVVRETSPAQAMLVSSIAFLDDLTRWNLVLFLDKLPAPHDTWITGVDRVGQLSWKPS